MRGGGAGRDITEDLIRPSRTAHRSNRPKQQPQPIIFNFNGNVEITNGGTMFGHAPEEELEQTQRYRPRLPAMPNAYRETAPGPQKSRRIIDVDDEEAGNSSEGLSDGDSYFEDEQSLPPSVSRGTPISAERVQRWKDSGCGSSIRGLKREKNEAYSASLNNRLSDGSLAGEGSSHKKRNTQPPSVKSNTTEGLTSEDNETHMAAQNNGDGTVDNAGDSDEDSDIV